jgi:hypothetical protein
MRKFFALSLVSVSLIAGMVSCNSTPGPQGPAGPQGPTGPQGPVGSPDVRYSPWFSQQAGGALEDISMDDTCIKLRKITRPDLTVDVINKAIIVVYFRFIGGGPYLLPYTTEAGSATNQINFTPRVGELHVYRHTLKSCRYNAGVAATYTGEPIMVHLPSSLEYRYVVIPGTVALAGAKSQADWQNMPYSEIKARFNIPD